MKTVLQWMGLVVLVFVFAGVLVALPEYMYSQQSISEQVEDIEIQPKNITAVYHGLEMPVPPAPAADVSPWVLGVVDDYKHIEVDLTNQRIYAFEGDRKVYDFLISSGKYGRTPTGTFRVWYKVRSTKMEGGSKALRTYYNLPNVPYTMFFYNENIPKSRGYGIHGAYWHNNFGKPMSHGCINMKPDEAGVIYQWANPLLPANKKSIAASAENPGTEIVIYGTAPMQ